MNDRFFWLAVLTLNVSWVYLLPNISARIVAALGAAVALLLAATRQSLARASRPACLGLFVLPAISLLPAVRLAFWRLDGRAWLIIAWILCAMVLERASNRKQTPAQGIFPLMSGLYIFWTSALWLTIVLDLGVNRFVVNVDRTVGGSCRGDSLATIASIWQSTPVSQHLFLAWRSPSSFADKIVYENHVHPYLFTMYGWMASVHAIARVPWYVASNSTALLLMGIVVGSMTLLLARSGVLHQCRGATGSLVLFVAVGFVITTWRFWNDLLRFNTDNPYPLLAAVFVSIYAFLLAPARPRLAIGASAFFVALSPIQLPTLVLAVACLFGRPGKTVQEVIANNRLIIRLCAWSTIVAGLVMALPWTLVAWKGYRGQASTFLFRSGLDGDTSYFSNMIQAAWSACPTNCCGSPRPISSLLLPAFLPLALFLWPLARTDELHRFGGAARLATFLATPYLVSLVFFPQSVSIHPYLYDHLILVPAVVAGAAAMASNAVRSRLHGPGLLGFLIAAAALIMSNLIGIAQALASMP